MNMGHTYELSENNIKISLMKKPQHTKSLVSAEMSLLRSKGKEMKYV
jgi:hypothetical protein